MYWKMPHKTKEPQEPSWGPEWDSEWVWESGRPQDR